MGNDLLDSIIDNTTERKSRPTEKPITFHIKKFVLQGLLEKAITVVPTRDVMPVLKCFQFQITQGIPGNPAADRLRIVASDMEMTLVVNTPMVSIDHPGTVVFPAKRLLEIIKAADDTDVTIQVKNNSARIAIGRASWALQLQGGYDYPALPAVTDAEFVTVDRTQFSDAITAVRYAASRDPARANLNIIDIQAGKLTACDGSRIQQIAITDFPLHLRVPVSAVSDLLRLLKTCETDTIDVGQSDTKLIFKLGNDTFIVSKFFAQFPDMEAAMLRPALENKHTLDIDRALLQAAIRRVRINADDSSSVIILHLNENTVELVARDKVGNLARETIDAIYTGPDRHLSLNHKYLTDMINAHHDDTCTFRLGDDTKTRRAPVLLRSTTGAIGVVQQMNSEWLDA